MQRNYEWVINNKWNNEINKTELENVYFIYFEIEKLVSKYRQYGWSHFATKKGEKN